MTDTPRAPLQVGARSLALGARTHIMGVLNVTPDSFSDGGRLASVDEAVRAGVQLVAEGADLVDVGGESTRPGAAEVPVDEELGRVLPVIRGLVLAGVRAISVDTRKAAVAEAALAAGAGMVNDVSGGRHDPRLLEVVAAAGVPCVLMHTRDVPARMQQGEIHYDDVVAEVRRWLEDSVARAVAAGVSRGRILVDPGIGFGKTLAHNLALTRGLGTLRDLAAGVLYGPSRKSFLGQLLGGAPPGERLEGTLASVAVAAWQGADIVRVHDVKPVRRLLTVVDALARGAPVNAA